MGSHRFPRSILLADEYSTRISGFLARKCVLNRPIYAQQVWLTTWVWPIIYWESNPGLQLGGNLYGARAWYFFITGCTEATFSLPQKTPNSYATLGFWTWYAISDSVLGCNANNTCIKEIKTMYNTRKESKKTRLKVIQEFLEAKSEAGQAKVAHVFKPGEEGSRKLLTRRLWNIVTKHSQHQSTEAG